MRRIHRRKLLKLSGVSTLAAGSGLAGILASGQAPAFAQGTTLQWLKFVDFVPVLCPGSTHERESSGFGKSLRVTRW